MRLTEEGLETLLSAVAGRLADDPHVHALLVLNHRQTSPERVYTAIRACKLTMETDDLLIEASAEGKTFLYPLGGMIADAINDELNIHCGFIMT